MRLKRTSIKIDPDLWMRVKGAAKPGAVYQYVEKALREKLAKEQTEAQRVHSTTNL